MFEYPRDKIIIKYVIISLIFRLLAFLKAHQLMYKVDNVLVDYYDLNVLTEVNYLLWG
jgi:hypothetical protein